MEQTIGNIEMVTFKTKPEIKDENAREALESLTACVSHFPGFIGRKLGKSKEGQWIDLIYWSSRSNAEKAAGEVMQNPQALKAFEVIDESTMEMSHFDVTTTFTPEF